MKPPSFTARSRRRTGSAGTVLLTAWCALAFDAGCVETPCGPRLSCDPSAEAVDDQPPCADEPKVDAAAEDRCGVFASSSLGDDKNPGTRDAPVRTIGRALAIADQGPVRRLFVCTETFAEAVRVPGGIAIWGGLDCKNGWRYRSGPDDTVIEPEPDGVPLTFEPGDLSRIFDVRAHALAAMKPGGSSIAAIALSGATVELTGGALSAGNGARGSDGAPGHPMNLPGTAGTHGRFGEDACTEDFVPGGDPVQTVCEEEDSIGGRGGEGATSHGGNGGDGELMPLPNASGFGLGGQGATSTEECMNGNTGANGLDGVHGLGPGVQGRLLDETGYLGVNGGDGGKGFPGQGGGGGGGTRGGEMFCGNARKAGGASGGSGGSGGCGARGGQGGQAGGASIGLVLLDASVRLKEIAVEATHGGDGGDGGFFQIGGAPGLGAPGGQGVGGSPFGCSGGDGGKGGNGGHGAGGLGGPSIAVAHLSGVLPALELDVKLNIATGGKGGMGANPSVPGSAGDDGVAEQLGSFPQ